MKIECPHADQCAGCPAIDQPYEAQLAGKEARVDRAIARFRSLERIERGPVAAADPVIGYRTRAKLVVDGASVGLHAREGDHVVVDIPECRVLSAVLRRATAAIRRVLSENAPLRRALLAVDLREARDARSQASVLVTLVLDETKRLSKNEIALGSIEGELRRELPELAILAVSDRARRAPQLLGRELRVIAGRPEVDDVIDLAGRTIAAPAVPGGFAQVHRGQAARIRERLLEAIEEAGIALEGARVVDAYAGAGALGLGLAAAGANVLLVESFAPVIVRAREAAERQRLRVTAVSGDAVGILGDLVQRGRSADLVVLNPPRRGVPPAARCAAAALGPRRIAYVSCEPDTLARDLDHFARLGYAAATIEPFDMIPLTLEVESLAVLAPAPAPPPRVVHREPDLVVLDKPPHVATTPHPEQPGSLIEDARAQIEGFAEATAVHRLDAGTSGLVLVARAPGAVTAWASALSAGEKAYFALVRGVTRPKGNIARQLLVEGRLVDARTRYKRLAILGGHSLLRVTPETGRTHQIRRHLAGLGHPVLGDARHGHAPSNRHFEERFALDRPFLHCARIALETPRGARLEIRAELPGDLETVLDRLGGVPEWLHSALRGS